MDFLRKRSEFFHVAFVVLKDDRLHAVTRHDVEVDVLHRLSGGFAVVLQDVESVAPKRRLQMRSDFPYARNDRRECLIGGIESPSE